MQRRLIRWLAYLAGLVASVLATIVLVFAVQARLRLPELHAWHRVALEQEFRNARPGSPTSLPEALALEQRLFDELQRRVLDDPAAADTLVFGRYNPRSVVAGLALDTR